MKVYYPFSKTRSVVATTLLASIALVMAGCTKPKAAVAPPVAPGNSAQKLSASELEKRIKEVQDNKTLPESAKPSIIQSIRAQSQP